MAPRLSKRDADAIDECIRDNPQCDMNEVAVLYGCTYNAVSRRRANIRRISLTGVDHRHKAGRPRIVTPEMLELSIYGIWYTAREVTGFKALEECRCLAQKTLCSSLSKE